MLADSVFNKMSRKDKYESNNRRQQTFMSPEDVASGRKSAWQGVEITGKRTCSDHFGVLLTNFLVNFRQRS